MTRWVTKDPVSALTGSEAIPITQAGVDKRVSPDQMAAFTRFPKLQSVISSATVTPSFDDDLVRITAQAVALTLANPVGAEIEGLGIAIRIKDNGTARTIAFDTQYRAIGVTLPATTVIGKTTYIGMIYNQTETMWDVVAVGQES